MDEVWKDIEGFEGLYQISNLGNVKSLNYCGHGYAKILTPKCNNSGRLWVDLRKSGQSKPMLIHRLVGTAFIPNPNNLPEINHIDENPRNNNANNLEWCTSLYNHRYSFAKHPERAPHLLRKQPYPVGDDWKRIHGNQKKSIHGPYKLKKPVEQKRKSDSTVIRRWDSIYQVCKETNWKSTGIKECCEGKRKTAYGYCWQYAN